MSYLYEVNEKKAAKLEKQLRKELVAAMIPVLRANKAPKPNATAKNIMDCVDLYGTGLEMARARKFFAA